MEIDKEIVLRNNQHLDGVKKCSGGAFVLSLFKEIGLFKGTGGYHCWIVLDEEGNEIGWDAHSHETPIEAVNELKVAISDILDAICEKMSSESGEW